MFDFIKTHHQVLTTSANLVMMIIWLLYLNFFYIGMRRSRRPMILISRSAGTGREARLFISNMGAEPIYVSALIADFEARGKRATAYITQNDHISSDQQEIRSATNEGPLGSGEYLDAGSFGNLMTRIRLHADMEVDPEDIEHLTLTVVAATGYSALISAGRKSYRVIRNGEKLAFHPEKISTEQMQGWLSRHRIRKRLEADLKCAY